MEISAHRLSGLVVVFSLLAPVPTAFAQQRPALQIKSFSVGPDQIVSYPSSQVPGLPDEHTSFIPPSSSTGPYLLFGASNLGAGSTGGAVVLETTDFINFSLPVSLGYSTQVMTPPTAIDKCDPAYVTEFDGNYAAPGSVVQDPTLPAGNFIMIYEAENHCPGGVANVAYYATAGFARSSDSGKTWPAPINGVLGGPARHPVLQSSDPQSSVPHSDEGDAIPSAFVDLDADQSYYLYVTYGYHPASGSGDGLIRVARAKLGADPLNFQKWYNGSFSQPGIGGSDTGVTPSTGCANGTQLHSEITYNDDLGSYLMIFVCVNGPTGSRVGAWYYSTATSLDLQDWTTPQMIQNSQFPNTSPCPGLTSGEQFDGWYPSTVSPGAAAGHTKLTGYFFFLNGCNNGARQFTSRTFTIVATAAPPAPSIGGLANNYSYITPGLPNYGIAQGSIFDIFGTNLVSSPAPLQSVPLAATLNGVTVNVTVNGTTTHPILYSLFHGQPDEIGAILPSATPVGTGTITVTTSAGTSATFPIVVVQSAFGILTLSGYGTGMAAGFVANNDYVYLGYTSAANPGDTIELWGTGLGPVSGSETVQQTQQSLSNYPIEVDIGGVSATVTYWGRSLYPGLDQIDVVVPLNVGLGCSVSVVVWSRNFNIVSNVATMPVAASGGRTCSDPTSGLTATQLQTISGKSSFTGGGIEVTKTTTSTPALVIVGTTVTPASTTTTDTISAGFFQVTQAQLTLGVYGQSVSLGSCSVTTFAGTTVPGQSPQFTPLNAGTINVTAPTTTATMSYQNGGYLLSTTSGTLIPASGGSFNFNNGSGGPAVGVFAAQLALPPPLVWSNMSSITTVNRSAGVTVKWATGAPGTYVTISGDSIGLVGANSYAGAVFECTAPVSAQQFTVPATVLLALPPSGTITENGVIMALPGSLTVASSTNPATFNATGVDVVFINGTYSSSQTITYQ